MSEDENSIITNLEYFLGNEKKCQACFSKELILKQTFTFQFLPET